MRRRIHACMPYEEEDTCKVIGQMIRGLGDSGRFKGHLGVESV
jgi:hypothetical protein